ncbi:MAG: malate/lactate/ureidoglycolate dehydrogenase [Geminicoccaceae bacterium]
MNIAPRPLRKLAKTIFMHAGSSDDEAAEIAGHLVEANLAGHDSHGVIRIAPYLKLKNAGKISANQQIGLLVDAGALAIVDGKKGYGQPIARQAIDVGIERAKQHGVAIVGIRNTAHLGRIGAWAEQAAAAGLASLHFVNTTGAGIRVAPFGGSDARLSVNPMAMGVPRKDADPIIHDMSTGVIAAGKVRVAHNKGALLPDGCIIDGHGKPSREPGDLFGDPPGALLPLGGDIGGHKGYGLAVFCELFAGALTGGGSSHPDNPDANRLVNNMFSILIDPDRLAGGNAIAEDIDRLTDWLKASKPINPGGEILMPGEPEKRSKAKREANGIPLDDNTLSQIKEAAEGVGVDNGVIEAGLVAV